MSTATYSLDEETKKGIEQLAKQARKSRSDIVREMYQHYIGEKQLQKAQAIVRRRFMENSIETYEDLERFLKAS